MCSLVLFHLLRIFLKFRFYISKMKIGVFPLQRELCCYECLILSTYLIRLFGHRKAIRKLTFRTLALCHSEVDCFSTGFLPSLFFSDFLNTIDRWRVLHVTSRCERWVGWGVPLGIFGMGVRLDSPNPGPISDQNM